MLSYIFTLTISCTGFSTGNQAPSLLSTPASGDAATDDTGPPITFVGRSEAALILDGKSFRFSGTNIYWLGLREISGGGATYPSHFMVDDALATAALMGATVVRSHTLGASVGCQLCLEPAPGKFNPAAFQAIDYAVQSAKKHHLRLIIPLVDNWHYYSGGKHNFTDWHGIPNESAFYYNSSVVSDFKQYVSVILNHVNSYTGIAYKDDPTILAWETGNELDAPFYWVQAMAAYIKSIDHHHLLMDGNAGETRGASLFWQDLKISSIDLYTGHYYPPSISSLHRQAQLVHASDKVFIVGEYDWNTTDGDTLNSFLNEILGNENIAGDMYWSLFPHNDESGYLIQDEHYTLYYPGNTPDMRQRIQMLRTHAYAMQGVSVTPKTPVGTPLITSVQDHIVSWRGAFGADRYSIERSTEGTDGPWTVVCDRCVTDFSGHWIDRTQPGQDAWYRMRGYSVSDVPGPYSNSAAMQL
jgi:hypothetical protein